MKKKISRRSFLKAAAGAAALGALAGCGGSKNETAAAGSEAAPAAAPSTEKPVTIKILFKGPKPDGFDGVYQEFLARTKDTLNTELDITFVEHADYKDKLNLEMTAGADYDLVFDAPWVHLKELAADEYYADLSAYFNNDAYPGLKKAFSEEVMNANKWYGQMCYIPFFRAYGNGVPAVWYRKDWAEEWGIGTIDSMAALEAYWDQAKAHGVIPFSARNTRGFFQLYTIGGGAYPATDSRPGTAQAGIQAFSAGGCTFWTYIQNNEIKACALEGSGDEYFADFPEGYNYDFGVDRFEKFAEYQKKGYISADSMTVKDAETPFWSGEAASDIGTLDDTEKMFSNIVNYSPNAKLAAFVYIDCLRNMEDGTYPTTYGGNNGMCVPANSKNIDRTMKFLDWLFGSADNHNLFELGVEGKDWEAVGTDQFKDLTGYAAGFPGYGFTWNPNYVKFSSSLPEDILPYRMWETKQSSFCRQPVCGFSFDTSSPEMATCTAQTKAVADKVAISKLHGILSDGTTSYSSAKEMLNSNVAAVMAAGADKIQAELLKQLSAFLAENPQG
ncbi:MAG: extracellular solute-binding protein [Faecalibacterium sp.]